MRKTKTFQVDNDTMVNKTHLPELGTNLVTTLAGLDVDDFSHFYLLRLALQNYVRLFATNNNYVWLPCLRLRWKLLPLLEKSDLFRNANNASQPVQFQLNSTLLVAKCR